MLMYMVKGLTGCGLHGHSFALPFFHNTSIQHSGLFLSEALFARLI